MITCWKCNIPQPHTAYQRSRLITFVRDQVLPACRECTNKQNRENYYKNRVKRSAQIKRYRETGYLISQEDKSHERFGTPERYTWQLMIKRCTDPKDQRYECYGGRGIKVCPEWLQSFPQFFKDMGERPSPKHSIDRIDVNGDYRPDNCRWATKLEQARNTRRNRYVEYQGKRMCVAEVASMNGLEPYFLNGRLRDGWDLETALREPKQPYKRLTKTEIEAIHKLRGEGFSYKKIGKQISRPYSTVAKELKRMNKVF